MNILKLTFCVAAFVSIQAQSNVVNNVAHSDAGYHLLVKFKNPLTHESLKSTPETTAAINALSSNNVALNNYAIEHHVNSNPIDPSTVLMPLEMTTGLELEHSRSVSLGYDELTVQTEDLDSAIQTLKSTSQFESVEPVFMVYQTSSFVSDPLSNEQFYFRAYTAKFKSNSNFDLLHAGFENLLNRKIRFAVLDSGSWDHEDVQFSPGYNFVSSRIETNRGRGEDTSAKYTKADGTSCQNGHGLAVASIIAATRNNGVGMIGAFPSELAEIVPVRVLGCGAGTTTDVMEGLLWAAGGDVTGVKKISNPVDVANLSLGSVRSNGCTRYEQDIINKVVALGVKVITSAGNDNVPAEKFSPGACGNVINVGALTRAGDKANFSNYGAAVDVVAEGDSVYVADLNVDKPNSYVNGSGTSYAAPLVASLVGAMIAKEPSLTSTQVEARLKYSAIRNPSTNLNSNCRLYGCGAGLVQVQPAMNPQQENNTRTYSVQHRYQGFTSPADLAWMTELQTKATACQTLKYTMGTSGFEQPGTTYKIYLSSNGGAPSMIKEVNMPQFIYPTPDNSTLSFQRCLNGSCFEPVTMNAGSVEKPSVCM